LVIRLRSRSPERGGLVFSDHDCTLARLAARSAQAGRVELKLFLVVGTLIIAAGLVGYLLFVPSNPVESNSNTSVNRSTANSSSLVIPTRTNTAFTEVRTETFVASVPLNNAVLDTSPGTVSVGFRLPLGPSSTLEVTDATHQPVQLGPANFSDDRLTMTVGLVQKLSGPVSIKYTACSAGNDICQDGSFGFTVETTE